VTAEPGGYAADLAALPTWLAAWEARDEPDAPARRAASYALNAIDGALASLHRVRARLVGEIRAADDATAARADALLDRARE
jgi:hypothetical protein